MSGTQDLSFKVVWEIEDFPAYLLLTRQMQVAAAAATGSAVPAWSMLGWRLATYFAVPVLSVLGLGVVWAFDPVDLAPRLVAVFFAVWIANLAMLPVLAWWGRQIEKAQLRRWFLRDIGVENEVVFNAEGFAVKGDGFEGRYLWSDGPVQCRKWARHIAIQHNRMPVLLPTRGFEADVKEVFQQIDRWARAAQR